ncbi:hypothetical protein H4CHR_02910 [Variovorax sp. PBS-H4]|uniref:hypothetical protein n=1 Tax=Variovorax sp. PBS-H4 TaxID=434008 RepID=UPI0013195D2E|nr:hypothetical protein [Variovorax sp. PBS-H4]VTU31943.1 hypothetical protein H4CHR_02910 [Variovorax sp. PBS-H4]
MSKKIATKTFTAEMILEGSWGSRQLGKHESTMDLWEGDGAGYYFIEWDIPDIETTEGIGIWFNPDTRELTDYDGIFSLPTEAIALLEENGIKVGEEWR